MSYAKYADVARNERSCCTVYNELQEGSSDLGLVVDSDKTKLWYLVDKRFLQEVYKVVLSFP